MQAGLPQQPILARVPLPAQGYDEPTWLGFGFGFGPEFGFGFGSGVRVRVRVRVRVMMSRPTVGLGNLTKVRMG